MSRSGRDAGRRNYASESAGRGRAAGRRNYAGESAGRGRAAGRRNYAGESAGRGRGTGRQNYADKRVARGAAERPKYSDDRVTRGGEERLENDVLIGRNPVAEALKSGRPINEIIVQKGAEGSIGKILSKAKQNDVPVKFVDKAALDRIAQGGSHQGVAAFCAAHEYASMEDICAKARELGEEPLVVILDEIEDPHNLGAILRSAECAGASGVIIPKRRGCGLTAAAAKASAGAVEYMPCVRVSNISTAIDELKKEGFWIAGCDMDGSPYDKSDMTGRTAIVIGNEGRGLSRLVREKCDFIISIPILGRIDSLNASNAAAVALYEARRQRNLKKQ